MKALKIAGITVSALALVWVFTVGIDHLNWTGNGWCFKPSLQCYGLEK
jgi:hypothetical protein